MIAMMDRIREWIQSSVEDYMCHAPCTRCGTWYAELGTKHMQHAAIKPSFDNMVSKQIYLRIYLLLIQYSRRVKSTSMSAGIVPK